jgi:hypothetical protein
MRPNQILSELSTLGARVEAVDNRLCIDAPKGAISARLRKELRSHKAEVLRLVKSGLSACDARPRALTDPGPPQLATNEEIGQARVRFADHGTQPAWDDLLGATLLERRRIWCEQTLDAVYSGQLTLAMLPDGQLTVFPRGIAS